MITTKCNTSTTQSQQIRAALVVALDHGWVEWESLEDPLSAEDEYKALGLLAPHRATLKKMGVVFPTKAAYQDRLEVLPGVDSWVVRNHTKGTEYTVTLKGLRLDCSCGDPYGGGVGWCKHREKVEAYREVHGDVGPFGTPDKIDEPDDDITYEDPATEKRWDDIEFDLRQIDMLYELGDVQGPEYERWVNALTQWADTGNGPRPTRESVTPQRYDLTPYWTVDFPPSAEQEEAFQKFAQWYNTGEPIFRLTGSAGTGKSTLTQAFIQYLRSLTLPPKIAVAASINKAVKVQQRILKQWGLGDIQTHTCAQLFGVRRKIVDGDEVFAPDPDAYTFYKDYSIIFVDEASTINEQLWGFLLDATNDGLFAPRFVVIGDPAQLPPINEGESMALRYPCPNAHLATVQRYDGPIAKLADDVCQNLGRPSFPTFIHEVDPETRKGIYSVDRPMWEAMVRKVFTSEEYRQNPDFAKILAYTNKSVDGFNVLVRNALGYRAPWVVGERIIALAPYNAPGQFNGLTTSDEATILGIYEGSDSGVDAWFLTLDNGITIPVPRRPAEFEAHLRALQKSGQHGRYWQVKEQMASITYAYALTIHRSQGSTYNYTFLYANPKDFAKCKGQHRTESGERVLEKNQLLYVALTRPSQRLIICV